MSSSRRKFLRSGLLAGVAMQGAAVPLLAAEDIQKESSNTTSTNAKSGKITFLQTTDVHCQLHAHDELFWENNQLTFRKAGGYAHMATALDKMRAENPQNTITVDTGDMFQGSMLSVKTEGAAFVPLLNALAYDLYIPGNWEVVYYKENMQKLMGSLLAPKICTNMYHDLGDGKRGDFIFQPYQIMHRMGVKIGFLGYTDPLVPLRQSPLYSKGIVYSEPNENLAEYVKLLREQEKCDFVILLSHLGLSQQIALGNDPSCAGVDYIFGADTHERVRKPIQTKYTKIVEPGAFGSFIGRLDLEIKDGKIVKDTYELIEVDPQKYPANKEVIALIEKIEKPFKPQLEKVLGYTTVPLYRNMVVENTIDTLIVDALKWKIDVDVVLSNGFRFCPPLIPGKDGKAAITESYLYDMLPVESTVRTGKATGQQILNWLEKELQNVFAQNAAKRFGGWFVRFAGMEVNCTIGKPKGQRVNWVKIKGQALDKNKLYKIVACEREGDPNDTLCRIEKVTNPMATNISLHEVIKSYLASNSPVAPKLEGRTIATDQSPTLLTQLQGTTYQFK